MMSSQTKRPNQIFICYRREDTAGVVGRIYDRLVQRFGKDAIFKDVDSLPLGRDFRRHIDSVVSECCVALVVVGDRWIGTSGVSRLDDPRDYVRIEIESALKRDIPVIPILVQNAELPPDESLPESLKDFAYRNGISIGHDPHFHGDMDRLIKHLEELIEDRRKQDETQLATAPAAIPAPELVARAEGQGSSDAYQHPIQVSPLQELPPDASLVGGSPHTSAGASKHVETQTDFWIAAKDRRRIVLLYFLFWPVVGLIWTGAHSLLPSDFRISDDASYGFFLTFLSLIGLLVSLILAGGQTMILKGYIGPGRRWIGYTVAASVIFSFLRPLLFPLNSVFVLAISYYSTQSGLQWLLLRTIVKRAWLWIVAGVAAGTAYSLVAPAVGVDGWAELDSRPGWVLVKALLSSSLISVAEIVCLIRFRRK